MPRTVEHATHRALIDCGVELAKEFGMYGYTVEQLLTKSGISKGSLYHHFEDFVDLVECVQVRIFTEYVELDIAAIQRALDAATDRQKFFELISLITRTAVQPQRTESRLQRARIISATEGRERFAARIGEEQKLLNDQMTQVISVGQERGWIVPYLDAHALAIFVQGYAFGLLLNDVAAEKIVSEDWVAV
ncbi:MAG: TetR/AcrR family transcriptional regulator, partial [Ilumatobacteraceae bacterium]|nr:TetR/AcrR family transcriptional regulator [Ilumatobacteraceae bacterium]MDP4976427.1 TetR/AcrR family transcriptional regulator [Ilumatobacteraceae bacterium]